jgi:hypothetical protein
VSISGDRREWRYRRSAARIEPVVEEVLADYATSYVGRRVTRHEVAPPRPMPGITWSVGGELAVEFVHRMKGRDLLLVHDIALLEVLKKRLRTRHVTITYVETSWDE